MKLKHTIDYNGLENYLKSLNISEIEKASNQQATNLKLLEGHSRQDIEYFQMDNEYPNESIIEYGEPFLVDALGNDLSIVILTRKKYKLPTGRVVPCKFVKTIVEDCRRLYGTPLNGYWKIPSEFIKIA